MTDAPAAAEPTEEAADLEADATPEPEPTEAPAAADGESAEGEPKPEDESPEEAAKKAEEKPPTLSEAIRLKRKAVKIRQEGEAKLAAAEQRERAIAQREASFREQVEGWNRQVQPKLQELAALKRAAAEGRTADLFEALGLDPRTALHNHASELQDPEGAQLRRELAEIKREKAEAERQKREAEEHQQKLVAAQAQDWASITEAVAFDDELASVKRYTKEIGRTEFLKEVYQIHGQLKERGYDTSLSAVLAECERRARIHYGSAAPQPAAPSQGQGPGKPGKPAAQASPTSRRPVGVSQRAAVEPASEGGEKISPEELDRRAAEFLRRQSAAAKKAS